MELCSFMHSLLPFQHTSMATTTTLKRSLVCGTHSLSVSLSLSPSLPLTPSLF